MDLDNEQREKLNGFFVTTFNEILAWEDQSLRALGKTNLSVREMHIIEAVSILEGKKLNTMANIARVLSVSPGALTTAVNVLVKKGYVTRHHGEEDRRVVLVSPTQHGREINEKHKKFHDEMINFITETLSKEETDVLFASLERITKYFKDKAIIKR